MSLIDALLKTDVSEFEKPEEGTFLSKKLSKAVGSKKPVKITFRELPSKRINEIIQTQFDKKGQVDMKKSQRANAIVVSEAMIDPPLKNEELIKHFGCATAADLAVKLFEGELQAISDAIVALSGFVTEPEEAEEEIEEIKNS